VTREEAKAERIVRKFSRRVQVRYTRSIEFIYCGWPAKREICMKCTSQTGDCPIAGGTCPADQVREETLIGLRALLYARVKAKIVFPAP